MLRNLEPSRRIIAFLRERAKHKRFVCTREIAEAVGLSNKAAGVRMGMLIRGDPKHDGLEVVRWAHGTGSSRGASWLISLTNEKVMSLGQSTEKEGREAPA